MEAGNNDTCRQMPRHCSLAATALSNATACPYVRTTWQYSTPSQDDQEDYSGNADGLIRRSYVISLQSSTKYIGDIKITNPDDITLDCRVIFSGPILFLRCILYPRGHNFFQTLGRASRACRLQLGHNRHRHNTVQNSRHPSLE